MPPPSPPISDLGISRLQSIPDRITRFPQGRLYPGTSWIPSSRMKSWINPRVAANISKHGSQDGEIFLL
jgi:hypothetical protein